ncbi:MAG: N-formylglutamate amidohydrolase [Methanoregula sp.]|jgi:formiminoglutamase|nr:N-formylglutamate amidohydrolase [Methanoregula sp.]
MNRCPRDPGKGRSDLHEKINLLLIVYSAIVTTRYPFLISIPHGGTDVPTELTGRLALAREELRYYCDPMTRELYDFRSSARAHIDTPVSRMVVDLNRPPLPLPPRDPDGIIKLQAVDGKPVYREGMFPDMTLIHRVMMAWYFPYHQRIDELIDQHDVKIAFDCHSMLPVGSAEQKDAGTERPLFCLGNNGDRKGRAKKNSIATCPESWVNTLADEFRSEFSLNREVAINNPFSGGFISNAHYWRKGVPWIQIEVNRALYEPEPGSGAGQSTDCDGAVKILRERIWRVLTGFWDSHDADI